VPHARTGKLIVATSDEEIPALERILVTARANGVHDLEWLSSAEIRRLEPEVCGVRALFSPSTGIVDSHALMGSLRDDAQRAGAELVLGTPVLSSGGGRIEARPRW
jgi:L-2-hydroxyglutarate oxidase LhgO